MAPLYEFHVIREVGDLLAERIVTYDKIEVEYGVKGNIDIGTGVLTAPYTGMYECYFGGLSQYDVGATQLYARHNGKVFDRTYIAGGYYPTFLEFHVWLTQGDTLDIYLVGGGLRVAGPDAWETHFGGKLLYI